MANSGWSDGAWSSGFWGGFQDLDLTLTGVSGTLSLGIASGFQSANTQAGSFYNQVHLGSVSISIPANVDVTGVEGEVQSLTGWGSNGWGEFVYGGGVFADVGQLLPVTLASASGAVGSVSISASAGISPTGAEANTLLESVLVGAGAIVGEDGMVGAIGLGDESVVGTCNFTLTGVSGSTVVGDESIETDTGAPVTGVPGMTASLGDETTFISYTFRATGFSITSSVGQETVTGDSLLSLTGVAASGNISTVILWGRIVPSQNATWTEEAA